MSLAAAQQLSLPTTLSPDKQLKIITLNTLTGASFDVAYIRERDASGNGRWRTSSRRACSRMNRVPE